MSMSQKEKYNATCYLHCQKFHIFKAKQNNMNEQWEQWKPLDGLANRYNVHNIIQDSTGLVILLSEEEHDSRGLRISL